MGYLDHMDTWNHLPDSRSFMYRIRRSDSTVCFRISVPDLQFQALHRYLESLIFKNVFSLEFVVVVFAFLFVDLFDTLGTLIGVSTKAGMLDKDGKLPRIKGALMADAVATTVGAVLGTSTTTTFVESASGVTEGGRTGLTS